MQDSSSLRVCEITQSRDVSPASAPLFREALLIWPWYTVKMEVPIIPGFLGKSLIKIEKNIKRKLL